MKIINERRIDIVKKFRLIGIDELIVLLGEKSKQGIYNKHNRDTLPIPTYKVGKSLRWKLNEVMDYIQNLKN